MKKYTFEYIVIIVVLLIAIPSSFYFYTHKLKSTPIENVEPVKTDTSTNIATTSSPLHASNFIENQPVKIDNATTTFTVDRTDISLLHMTIQSGTTTPVTYTIKNADNGLLYLSKYQDGNFYIITCSDCTSKIAYEDRLTVDYGAKWSRQLQVFNAQNPQGKVLKDATSISDFAVSEDGTYIAMEKDSQVTDDGDVIIMDSTGKLIKTYINKELTFNRYVTPVFWKGHTLYVVSSGVEEYGDKVATINVDTNKISTYAIPGVTFAREFVFSPDGRKIAYSDFPFFGDSIGFDEWASSTNNAVQLYVYNLDTKIQSKIATSHAQRFDPTWVDSKTIQYTNPTTGKRATTTIK